MKRAAFTGKQKGDSRAFLMTELDFHMPWWLRFRLVALLQSFFRVAGREAAIGARRTPDLFLHATTHQRFAVAIFHM